MTALENAMPVAEKASDVAHAVETKAVREAGSPAAAANHKAAAVEQARLFRDQIMAFSDWACAASEAHGYASEDVKVAVDAVFKAAELVDGE